MQFSSMKSLGVLACLALSACKPKAQGGRPRPAAGDEANAPSLPLADPTGTRPLASLRLACDVTQPGSLSPSVALEGSSLVACTVLGPAGKVRSLATARKLQWAILTPPEVVINALVENPRLTPRPGPGGSSPSAPPDGAQGPGISPPYGPDTTLAVLDLYVDEAERSRLFEIMIFAHVYESEESSALILGGRLADIGHGDGDGTNPTVTYFPEFLAARDEQGRYRGSCDSESAIYGQSGDTASSLSLATDASTFCVYRPGE